MFPSRIFSLATVTGLVCLAGCSGKIHYPSYYVLNLPAPVALATPPKPLSGFLAVREFAGPPFLRSGPIVYRPTPEQLGFYDYHRWAVDPRRAVTSLVADRIRALGVFQSVSLYDGRQTPDYVVTGTLDHLEEVDNENKAFVQVGLSMQLTNPRTGEVVWQDASSGTAKTEHSDVPAIVAEMSRTVANAVEHLVSSMHARLTTVAANAGQ
jgi:ABC-type uncharacterized transport system auxiliary subunit